MDRHLPPNAALAALRIDGARLWQSLMDLAQIGGTAKGGVCRLALTELDGKGREEELARMLGGAEVSKEARAAARKLLAEA